MEPLRTDPTGGQAARPGRGPRRRAFTLVEAALVTVLISIGVVATLQLLAAGTVSNTYGTEVTTAVNLANNIREISLGLAFFDPETPTQWSTREAGGVTSYDDLLDLDGQTFSPPLDVRRLPMTAYANWAQQVAIDSVAEGNISVVQADTTSQPTARVTVTVLHNGKVVYRTAWLAVAPSGS